MSVVFGTIFISSLFFPGIFFRSGLFSSREDSFKRAIQLTVVGDIVWIAVLSIIFNTAAVRVCYNWYTIDFAFIYKIIGGFVLSEEEVKFFNSSVTPFVKYILYTSAIAYGLGKLLSWLLLEFQLFNNRYINNLLNFKNNWFFYLTGFGQKIDNPLVKADAIVEIGGESYLYTGYVSGFELRQDGLGYEYLILLNTTRRKLDDDNSNKGLVAQILDSRYYRIPGDAFILNANEIRNLNLTYLSVPVSRPTDSQEVVSILERANATDSADAEVIPPPSGSPQAGVITPPTNGV